MSLKLEVDPIVADVTLLTGQLRQTTFFVSVPDSVAPPSSQLVEQLNDSSLEFVPCQVGDTTHLLRVAAIAYVVVASSAPEFAGIEGTGALSSTVELQLVTGERLRGSLFVEGPGSSSRLSDHLNRNSERFLLLRTQGAATYVNRTAIVQVQEVS